jgi:hypothetical protein
VCLGSGRDSFHNPNSHRFQRAQRFNIGEEGFAYGSESVSRNARYKFRTNSRLVNPLNQKHSVDRLSAPSLTRKRRPVTATF